MKEKSVAMKLFLTSEYASNISGRRNNILRNQLWAKINVSSMFYMFSNINKYNLEILHYNMGQKKVG